MKYVALALAVLLSGCESVPSVVFGGCKMPAELDYVAQGPAPLPETDTPQDDLNKVIVKDRAGHRTLAKDFNKLHDHVKKDCQ